MTPTLTAFLLRARGGLAWSPAGAPVEWVPDHVVLDDEDGTVAALAFERSGAARVTSELALFAPQREGAGPDDLEDLRFLQSFASARGALFVRPGAGPAAAVHRRRFALPGRVLASGVPGAGGAGALGMLVLPVSALECAAAMAGEPLLMTRPRVVGVEWTGVPDPGVTGHDILLALERRLAGEGEGAVLEGFGVGILSLPMAERFAIAARASAVTGSLAMLFPSDDLTRDWLRAAGRDADWRRLEGPETGFDAVVSLDLSRVRPERAEGTRVRVGAFAEDADVHGLARALVAHPRRAEVALEVVVPGRIALEAWSASGSLEALRVAGAVVVDRADALAGALPHGTLVVGGDPSDPVALERERGVWACAALLTGHTAAETMVSAKPVGPDEVPAWDEVIEPMGGTVEAGSRHRHGDWPAQHDAPYRAVVLRVLPDDAGASLLLPWGPRVRAVRADASELASALFRASDPATAERAAAGGDTVLVAGERFGGGPHGEALARALAALGVRSVLAASFATDMERLLALHGVLPLRFLSPSDRRELEAGDEVELPPPIAESPGGRVALRHLTRGFTFDVRCALLAPLRGVARAGGLLRAVHDAIAEDAASRP